MALSTSVAARLVQNFLPSMLRSGLSSNTIINTLRSMGYGYRRQDMLTDIRHFSGLAKLETVTRAVLPTKQFPKGAMVETFLRRDSRYRVYAQITTENMFTRKQETRYVSFYTDTQDSKQGWLDSFLASFPDTESGTGFTVISAEVVSVEHQSGYDY